MSDELKPCPFCGGDAIIIEDFDYAGITFYKACCSTCRSETDWCYKSIDCISHWNTRHESGELPEWVKEAIENEVGQNLNKRSQLFYCGFVQALNWVLSLRKPEAHS